MYSYMCIYIQYVSIFKYQTWVGKIRSYDFSEEYSQVEPTWEPMNQNTFLQLLYKSPRISLWNQYDRKYASL